MRFASVRKHHNRDPRRPHRVAESGGVQAAAFRLGADAVNCAKILRTVAVSGWHPLHCLEVSFPCRNGSRVVPRVNARPCAVMGYFTHFAGTGFAFPPSSLFFNQKG